MPSAVVVNFQVGGIAQVGQAFRSVEQAVLRNERNAAKATQASQREMVRASARGAKDRERDYAAMFKGIEKKEKDAAKATEQAEKAKAKAVDAGAKDKIRSMLVADRIESQIKRQAVRDTERAEQEKNAAANKWVRQREREEIASARRSVSARMRFLRTIGSDVTRGATEGAKKVGGIAQSMVGTAMQLGGGFSIADSVQRGQSLERSAALLSNSAYIKGKQERPDVGSIVSRAKAVQTSTNIDANDLIEGTRSYVAKSSDYKGGMENMEFMAKLAKGSGTDFKDVANAAGTLRAQNKNLTADDMKETLLQIVSQGKQGSVELEDLAKMAGKITKTGAAYGMNQTDAQRQLLGMAQLAMPTSGGADEAATVVSNFGMDTLKHQKKIGAVTDKNGQLKDPAEIARQVFEKTGGNLGKIQDLGYGQRSMKMFEALAPTYQDKMKELNTSSPGMSDADKRKAAAGAVVSAIGEQTGAKSDPKGMIDDFNAVVNTSGERFEAAMMKLRTQVAEGLSPALEDLLPVLKEATPIFVGFLKDSAPAFVRLIQSLGEFASAHKELIAGIAANPIGSIMAAEVTKSILSSGLSGSFGQAGQAAGLLAAAFVAGKMAIDMAIKGKEDAQRAIIGGNIEADNEAGKLAFGGPQTPEEITRAKAMAEKLRGDLAGQKAHVNDTTLGEDLFLGGHLDVQKDARDANQKSREVQVQQTADSLDKLTKAIAISEKALLAHAGTATSSAADPKNPTRVLPQVDPARH